MRLLGEIRYHPVLMAVLVISAAILLIYAPLFGGYWLGDDFANILQSYTVAQEGMLLATILEYFSMGTSSGISMYRPLQMASLLGNYAVAGVYYPGWFAVNFALHLLNAILVFFVVRLFAVRLRTDTRPAPFLSPLLAALAFALAPSLAEGVFFVSARADALVTLFSLLSLLAWISSMKAHQERMAWWFPVLLVLALLIKESAAVLPLQMILLTVALWPVKRRQHLLALAASVLLVCGFFTLRWLLFGQVFGVYSVPGSAQNIPLLSELWGAIRSLGPWWQSLTSETPTFAALYLGLTATALLWALLRLRGMVALIVLALLCAAGGLALATLLNLGSLQASGEGGRLTYGTVCWFMVAMGVAMANVERNGQAPRVAVGLFAVSVLCGALVLHPIISQVLKAELTTRGIAQAIPGWSSSHDGHVMLLIPEKVGFVVATRNAQGSLVMPPVQADRLLHRVMPTLESELFMRYQQYKNGLATRLIDEPPRRLDAAEFKKMLKPAAMKWPDHYSCWSLTKMEILPLAAPRTATVETWTKDLQKSLKSMCNQ